MKSKFLIRLAFLIPILITGCNGTTRTDTSGGWVKYDQSPVLGGDLGTVFDVSVLDKTNGSYKMYCSWRPKKSIALSESRNGLDWSTPVICLTGNDSSSWEKDINRPSVLYKDGLYHMWYTGQADEHSWIGYATSTDGKIWNRQSSEPVISAELPWEKVAVMCPHVLYDDQSKLYKMWYSGGEQYEPDAIGYATSPDCINWTKFEGNPVFANNPSNEWEMAKVTACQVIKRQNDYLMFYIGFKNVDYAQIGMARSKDGISGWERFSDNPIIKPGNSWDSSAVYKPFVIRDDHRWLLYYNGRKNDHEQIGIAIHENEDLGF
jgi:beta-1,2-mannobiose phosphorylase / 1,2-beta-oligomannan phosphorylase